MGIVGYGSIGEATAKLAKAYGMKVLACVGEGLRCLRATLM